MIIIDTDWFRMVRCPDDLPLAPPLSFGYDADYDAVLHAGPDMSNVRILRGACVG
jgi:hypothetical protein